MSAQSNLIVSVILLSGCVNSPFAARTTAQFVEGALYKRGDSGEVVECQGVGIATVCGSKVLPTKIYFDCSDERFECIFDTSNVLAIPKTGFSSAQKYSVFGAELTVERCFGEQKSCEVAMVSSKCADAQICTCRAGMAGGTFYFYFVRNVGVTVFYSVSEDGELSGPDAKLLMDALPMYTYYLVGERGFLNMPMALEKATLRTNCRS